MLRNRKSTRSTQVLLSRRSQSPERGGVVVVMIRVELTRLLLGDPVACRRVFKSILKGVGDSHLDPSMPHLNAPAHAPIPHRRFTPSFPRKTVARPWRYCQRPELLNEACLWPWENGRNRGSFAVFIQQFRSKTEMSKQCISNQHAEDSRLDRTATARLRNERCKVMIYVPN